MPTSRPTEASGHPGPQTQLCQELPPGPSNVTPDLETTNPRIWLHPLVVVVGNSPRVFWILTLATSEPALALGPAGVL